MYPTIWHQFDMIKTYLTYVEGLSFAMTCKALYKKKPDIVLLVKKRFKELKIDYIDPLKHNCYLSGSFMLGIVFDNRVPVSDINFHSYHEFVDDYFLNFEKDFILPENAETWLPYLKNIVRYRETTKPTIKNLVMNERFSIEDMVGSYNINLYCLYYDGRNVKFYRFSEFCKTQIKYKCIKAMKILHENEDLIETYNGYINIDNMIAHMINSFDCHYVICVFIINNGSNMKFRYQSAYINRIIGLIKSELYYICKCRNKYKKICSCFIRKLKHIKRSVISYEGAKTLSYAISKFSS